jgi:hypothetical protein
VVLPDVLITVAHDGLVMREEAADGCVTLGVPLGNDRYVATEALRLVHKFELRLRGLVELALAQGPSVSRRGSNLGFQLFYTAVVRFTILHILFYTLGLTNSSTTGVYLVRVTRRRHASLVGVTRTELSYRAIVQGYRTGLSYRSLVQVTRIRYRANFLM